MFGRKNNIAITIKLFGGIDTDIGIEAYDPDVGLGLKIPDKVRLGKAIRKIGLNRTDSIVLFINGNPASSRDKLKDGDVVFCMKPLAGG